MLLGWETCSVNNCIQGIGVVVFLNKEGITWGQLEKGRALGERRKFEEQRNILETVGKPKEDHNEHFKWSDPSPFGLSRGILGVFLLVCNCIQLPPHGGNRVVHTILCGGVVDSEGTGQWGGGEPSSSADSAAPAEEEKLPGGGTMPRRARNDSS